MMLRKTILLVDLDEILVSFLNEKLFKSVLNLLDFINSYKIYKKIFFSIKNIQKLLKNPEKPAKREKI